MAKDEESSLVYKEASVSNVISSIGIGTYQVQVFLFCAGALMCETSQLASLSGVKTLVFDNFGVTSSYGQCIFTVCAYSGLCVGTITSGTIGDTHGRRLPMLVSWIGIMVSQGCLFFINWLPGFYFGCVAVGFFAGIGVPAAVTMFLEVTPSHLKGRLGAALCLGFCSGEFFSAVGLRIFVPSLASGPWRFQLLWAAIPPLCLVVCGLISKVARFDSPEFLAAQGRHQDLCELLTLIAKTNGAPEVSNLESKRFVEEENITEVSFSEAWSVLTKGITAVYTLAICLLFFTFNFGYYGSLDFWPIAWEAVKLPGVDKATEVMGTAVLGFIGAPVAICGMSLLPRRTGSCIATVVVAVAAYCLEGLLTQHVVKGWIGVILFKSFWWLFQMTAMVLPTEIYPARVSVWAWSIVGFVGRIGCVLSPIAITISDRDFLWTLLGLCVMCTFGVWLLPAIGGSAQEPEARGGGYGAAGSKKAIESP